MDKIWANRLIAGTKTWAEMPARRHAGVKAELAKRVAEDEITRSSTKRSRGGLRWVSCWSCWKSWCGPSLARGDKQDTGEPEPAPQAPGAEAVTGWEGEPPYRFIDVSRYQGLIDWAQVAAAGYKGSNAQGGEHQPQALQAGRRPVYRPHL